MPGFFIKMMLIMNTGINLRDATYLAYMIEVRNNTYCSTVVYTLWY